MKCNDYHCQACGAYHEVGTKFYVSVRDGSKVGFLLGPYDTHQQALDQVGRGRDLAYEHDPKAPWYGYGTAGSTSELKSVFGV